METQSKTRNLLGNKIGYKNTFRLTLVTLEKSNFFVIVGLPNGRLNVTPD